MNTEPVREAARVRAFDATSSNTLRILMNHPGVQFWVSFYEQAAQVRIPTTDDFSANLEQQSNDPNEEEADNMFGDAGQPGMFDPNMTPSESSFAPENAAVSSTPMIHSMGRKPETGDADDMWADTMESPLKRLGKGLQSLSEEEDSVIDYNEQEHTASQQSMRSDASSARRPVFTAQEKGKGKPESRDTREKGVSKSTRGAGQDKQASPVKTKKNPYVPSDVRRADWDGIVDLRKPTTPRAGYGPTGDWSSDEEDFPPPNLSPPRSAFAKRLAPIGRTPVREAAARIGRDLVGDAERVKSRHRFDAVEEEPSFTESSPSTPSLSVFTRRAMGMESSEQSSTSTNQSHANESMADTEPSLDSMMRRFGINSSKYEDDTLRGPHAGAADDSFDDSFDEPGPVFSNLNSLPEDNGGGDLSGEGDSSDEESFRGHTGAPSAAFLMASARQSRTSDDSFEGSDQSMDSLDSDYNDGAGPPIHPFAAFGNAQGDDSYDDSLDYDDVGGGDGEEEPTVFGLQPQRGGGGPQLQLLGQDLVDDTTALNSRLRPNMVPDTPTPWTGANQGGSRQL